MKHRTAHGSAIGRYAVLKAREPHQRLSFPPASWDQFRDRFHPMRRLDGSYVWPARDIPPRLGNRHVWTVTRCNGDARLVAGRRIVDAAGYVLSAVAWVGGSERLPAFRCPEVTS